MVFQTIKCAESHGLCILFAFVSILLLLLFFHLNENNVKSQFYVRFDNYDANKPTDGVTCELITQTT